MKPVPIIKKRSCSSLMFVFLAFISFVLSYIISVSFSTLPWQFLDELSHQCALSLRSPTTTIVMSYLSWWGKWGVIGSCVIIVSSFCLLRRWRYVIWSIWIAVGGWLFAESIKILVDRSRPTVDLLATEISRSYPSAHSLTSLLLCLSLSYLCFHFSRRFFISYIVFFLSMLLALAVGMSRIYLGVHYLSDVIGGYLLGIGFYSLSLYVLK